MNEESIVELVAGDATAGPDWFACGVCHRELRWWKERSYVPETMEPMCNDCFARSLGWD